MGSTVPEIPDDVLFSLPIVLIGILAVGLCCTFCCYMFRLRRRERSSPNTNDAEQPRREFPRGLKKVNYRKKWLKKSKLKDDMCTICLDDFENKEEVSMCKCGHAYHNKCIMKWLEIKNTCPICQRNVWHQNRSSERTPLLHAYAIPIDA